MIVQTQCLEWRSLSVRNIWPQTHIVIIATVHYAPPDVGEGQVHRNISERQPDHLNLF